MFILAVCLRSKLKAPRLHNLRYSQILKYSRMRDCEQHSEVLQKLLGCSPEESEEIVKNNAFLQKLDTGTLQRTIKMLHRTGIESQEILGTPYVMTISPACVEHHSMVLEEGGIKKVTLAVLLNYFFVVKKRISLLKAYKLFDRDTNVLDSFLSYLEPAPPHAAPLPFSRDELDSITFLGVYEAVLKHYLMWRLEMGPEEMDRIMSTYRRLKHKSLRHYRRTLDLLEGELGFTKERIRKHGYLIHSHPDNTLDTLRRVESLGGLDIRSIIHKYPKIMMTTTDTLIQTNDYLKKFGVSDFAILRCPYVFTLGSESVRRRLEVLHKVPEFKALISHPRVLRLVYYQRKALTRLDFLQEQRVRCASLHLLSSTRAKFDRYTHIGEDRNRGTDTVIHLAGVLGSPAAEIRARMQRHCHWQCIPLVSVCSTLDVLFALGYSKEDIFKNIQLLLYPKELVERELELVSEREETVTAQELCSVPALTPDLKLALCLYYIEKVHHFTGDGLWTAAQSEGEPAVFDMPPMSESDLPRYSSRAARQI